MCRRHHHPNSPGSLLEVPLLASQAGWQGSPRSLALPDVGLTILIQHLPLQAHPGLRFHGKGDASDDNRPASPVAEVQTLTDFAPAGTAFALRHQEVLLLTCCCLDYEVCCVRVTAA